MLTQILGWSLAIASTLTILPTPIKLYRKNSSAGISLLTCFMATVAMLAWCFYTFSLRDYPALASSLGPLICWFAAICILALKYGESKAVIYLVALIPITILLLLLPTNLQGALAVTGSLLWAIPQLRKAITHSDLAGVSILSYLFVALENLAWVIYAVLTTHYAYAYAPLLQGPVAVVIALKALKNKKV